MEHPSRSGRLEIGPATLVLLSLVLPTTACRGGRANTDAAAADRARPAYLSDDSAPSADVGDVICVPFVDFSKAERNFVIVTSPTCPACQRSKEFYRALTRYANWNRDPIYFVFAGGEQASPAKRAPILGDAGVGVELPLRMVGIRRVPTIAVVDRNGKILALRTGLVSAGQEQQVIDEFARMSRELTQAMPTTDLSQLNSLRTSGAQPQIIDPRGIEQHTTVAAIPGETQMFARDISIRARYELDPKRPVIVDCRTVGSLRCQDAIFALRGSGFKSVAGLGLRRLGASAACDQ